MKTLTRLGVVSLLAACHSKGLSGGLAVPHEDGAACERLAPARSLLTHPTWEFALEQAALSRTLLARARELGDRTRDDPEQLILTMIKDDLGRPQEAVYIMRTRPRPRPPEYRVIHVRAREALVFPTERVEVDLTETTVESEIVRALEQSWGTMALGARWPDRKGQISRVRSGASYTFEYRGDYVYGQGDTVNPDSGTCSASLVELAELVAQFADEPDPNKRSTIRAELLRNSHILTERLKVTSQ
jgi:hypothetical protein